MDERQWIWAIQRGDKKYLQDIAEKYYDDIFRFCAFQSGSIQDAYDLAQETFVRFIRYVESYQYRNLKGYLLTIAMNVCRNYHRGKGRFPGEKEAGGGCAEAGAGECMEEEGGRRKREERAVADRVPADREWSVRRMEGRELSEKDLAGNEPDPETVVLEQEETAFLMEALGTLPDVQREAILLHYFHDMKYREIGRLTGVSVATVKSRVRQGVEKLRGQLRKEDFYPE